MTKKFTKISTILLLMAFILSPVLVFPVNAEEATDETVVATSEETSEEATEEEDSDDAVDLIEAVTSDDEEELDIEDITDEELLEAEPSDLPNVEEDSALTEKLAGRMLLDVEGNGEVYYVDPVTGGKEYLADGESAQLLLRRRALGINEANFAKLILGEEKDDASVCEENELGSRLRGRIVLRTEENGEAYWILPTNCRAYYAGTYEASYELMKKFSLGIVKKTLAKIRNNNRQKMKNALRLAVYAHAEDNDMTLKEAREDLQDEVVSIKACMEDSRANDTEKSTGEVHRERVRTCVQSSEMPKISQERREEIKETIQETRQARKESAEAGQKKGLGDFNIGQIFQRVKQMIQNRIGNQSQE
jgi:hypothetical protein